MLLAILPAILALLIASGVSAWQLLSSNYPNTWFLFTLRRSKALYIYCLLYGGVAFLITLTLDSLITNGIVIIEGLKLESPWIRALIVGLTARGFVQISFFDITAGARVISVGPVLVLQLFEPWLVTKIQQDEDSELRRFVQARAQHRNLDDVRQEIKGAPSSLPHPERVAFEIEIDEAKTVEEAMEKHVKALGRKSFNTTFPPKS
jgi:hypothetical protein